MIHEEAVELGQSFYDSDFVFADVQSTSKASSSCIPFIHWRNLGKGCNLFSEVIFDM